MSCKKLLKPTDLEFCRFDTAQLGTMDTTGNEDDVQACVSGARDIGSKRIADSEYFVSFVTKQVECESVSR